jgi:hypothetical protein
MENKYIIGKSYNIEYNDNNINYKWYGFYVGNNIYVQATFKINNNCIEKDNIECPWYKNKNVTVEIISNEPIYQNECLCQYVCIQDDKWLVSE